MEAISDLSRLRCALTRSVRIRTSAIAADNLDSKVSLEPVRHGGSRAIRQQVHHLTTLQVHDDGPVIHAFPPSPLVDADDTHHGTIGLASAAILDTPRIVVSLTGMPSRAISRSDGRPPTLWPNSLTIPARRVVRRANGAASRGCCSAKIHSYLIHHILAERGFNPPGVVFPVSAAILERIDDYRQVLESFRAACCR